MGRRLLDLGGKAKAAGIGAKAAAATGAAIVALVVCAGLAGGSTSSGSSSVECRATAGNSQIPGTTSRGCQKRRRNTTWDRKARRLSPRSTTWSPIGGSRRFRVWRRVRRTTWAPRVRGSSLVPSWEAYGVDADGDGVKDPYSVPDSVFATAHLLHEDGAPKEWRQAIWDYNHAWWYVEEVLEKAETLRDADGVRNDIGGTRRRRGDELGTDQGGREVDRRKKIHYCWGGGS